MRSCENFGRTSAPRLPQAVQTKRPYFTSKAHQIAKATDVMAHEIRTAVAISLIHSQ
jgi:DNA-binding transcriptional regulator YdaS (Cro superfamily)